MSRHRFSRSLARLVLLWGILIPAGRAAAATLSFEVLLDPRDLRLDTENGATTVSMLGSDALPDAEGYVLPVRPLMVPLPAGTRVLRASAEPLESRQIALAAPPARAADPATIARAAAAGDAASLLVVGPAGKMGGTRVVTLLLRGVAYDAARRALVLRSRVGITIETAPAPPDPTELGPLRESTASRVYRSRLMNRLAANATAAPDDSGVPVAGSLLGDGGHFEPGEFPSLDGSTVEYVMVTSDSIAPELQRLADWKTRTGIPAVVKTVSWIEAHYPGRDRAERIRNFLKDAYRYWGTTWVLLGGDTPVIPARLAHCSAFGGEDIAADLYYSDLDGTWDGDGDGIFGEGWSGSAPGDSVDLYPDVFVGRAPVETAAEARTFVDKTLTYLRTPVLGYQNDVTFIAEVFMPFQWHPPEPIQVNGCTWAHRAGEYVPSTWDSTYICQYPNDNETHASIMAALNQSSGLISVMGHGDPFKWSTSDGQFISIDDAVSLSNYRKYFVLFFADCNTNQLETEAINEYTMLDANGGAVACVGATRLDFPTVGEFYQREFFSLFYQAGIEELGVLEALMKVPRALISAPDNSYDRWTQLIYCLLGDPQLRMWPAVPRNAAMLFPPTIAVGDSLVTVTVRTSPGLQPIERAMVTLWKQDTGEYARGLTGPAGTVTFPFRPVTTGTLLVTATSSGYFARVDSLQVVAGAADLRVAGVTVDDDSTGASRGNGDGVFDAGETVELGVTLQNASGTAADSVAADLALPGTSALRAGFARDGVDAPRLFFVGAADARASSFPLSLIPAADSLLAWGRPFYTARAKEDSSGLIQVVPARGYLWQDASGWHVRVAGAGETHSFDGYIVTTQPLLTRAPAGLEPGDTWGLVDDSLHYHFSVDSTDFEDGLDFVVADSAGLSLTVAHADYGPIPAGGGATRRYTVHADPGVAGGRIARFLLDVAAAGGIHRHHGVRADIAAPGLALEYNQVDDPAPGGNGNGLAEAGETVAVTLHAENRGGGVALGATATLRNVTGATVADSVTALGDLAAGARAAGSAPFRLTLTSDPAAGQLVFRTAHGQEKGVPFELGASSTPGAPTGPVHEVGPTWADIAWTPVSAADVSGYVVYRSPLSGGAFTRVSGTLDPRACFRDEGLAPLTPYRYRYTAVDSAGNQSVTSATDTVWSGPAATPGFPVNAGNRLYSSVIPVDLDADGHVQLVVGTQGWKLQVFEAGGVPRSGFPRSINQETFSTPAVGNLGGGLSREIVIGSSDKNVYAFNADGSGFLAPSGLFGSTGGIVQGTPTLADLDRDGSLEVIVPSRDNWLYVWRANGTGYLNPDGRFGNSAAPSIGSAAVADVDNDGYLEIFVGTTASALYAWNHDGTPFRLPSGQFKYIGGGAIWASPVIGDIDSDGSKEIVCASTNDSVYVYSSAAVLKPGWPRATGNQIQASPALGDLDRDGKREVIVGSDDHRLYAWRYNGQSLPGFPVTLPDSALGSPVIGDITGDGFPDIVAGCADGHVFAYQRNGAPVPGWPQFTYAQIWHAAPALTDLDHDGKVDIVQGSYDGFVYAWRLDTPYNPATMDWPMFQHDRTHSGFAGWVDPDGATPVPGGGELATPRLSRLLAPWPNPARAASRISFDLAHETRLRLSVYDVAGRLVERLVDERRAAGRYHVAWPDPSRPRAVASGIYFLRMEADGGTWSRKLVIAW